MRHYLHVDDVINAIEIILELHHLVGTNKFSFERELEKTIQWIKSNADN